MGKVATCRRQVARISMAMLAHGRQTVDLAVAVEESQK